MNWKLLDISEGRANRLQFFVILLIAQILFLIGYLSSITVIKIILYIPAYYLMILCFSRRLRDMEIDYKKFLIAVVAILLIMALISKSHFITIAFSYPNLIEGMSLLAVQLLIFCRIMFYLLFTPLVSLLYFTWYLSLKLSSLAFVGFYAFLLFKKGDVEANKYGIPPVGLNFNSMISNNKGKDE